MFEAEEVSHAKARLGPLSNQVRMRYKLGSRAAPVGGWARHTLSSFSFIASWVHLRADLTSHPGHRESFSQKAEQTPMR